MNLLCVGARGIAHSRPQPATRFSIVNLPPLYVYMLVLMCFLRSAVLRSVSLIGNNANGTREVKRFQNCGAFPLSVSAVCLVQSAEVLRRSCRVPCAVGVVHGLRSDAPQMSYALTFWLVLTIWLVVIILSPLSMYVYMMISNNQY